MLLGRFVQTALFAMSGFLFYRLVTRHAEAIENARPKHLAIAVGALLAVYLTGLPWLNPDMFWAIGRGWVDAHYGAEPYLVPTGAISDFRTDPMFQNIDPGLLRNSGNYGPLHHSIATILAGLSGGNIRAATLLFKLTDLAFLLCSAAVLFQLARQAGLKAQYLTFCYLANPIVPLVFVAWGHNDIMQNFFLLLAVWCVYREKPLLSGAALGGAIALKYVAIVLAPALVLYWWCAKNWRIRSALLSLLGVVVVVCYANSMYEGAWRSMLHIYTVGWSPIRSSIYCIMVPITRWIEATTMAPARLTLSLTYVVASATLTFAMLWKREVKPTDFLRVCVWIFNFYFLFAAPAVLEWYLTWTLACLLLLPDYLRCFSVLYSFYMPLVPFTLYLPDLVQYPVNIALYFVFVGCVVFLTPWREPFKRERQALPAEPVAVARA